MPCGGWCGLVSHDNMAKMVILKCRVMFGQNILQQEKPSECAISVKADGSDSIVDIKKKIAVGYKTSNPSGVGTSAIQLNRRVFGPLLVPQTFI